MDKTLEVFKRVFTSKQAKRAYWNFANAIIGLLAMVVLDLNLAHGAVIVAVLNGLTKEINKKYLN